jgi:hypothetical protein
MTAPVQAPDPRHCPLCGQANGCAMETARATGQQQPPCWCTQVGFNREVLAQIPAAARGKACVCQACATAKVPAA